eukprot:TRINITY_DN2786_c2_g2_i1.p1 TRINITY_DN2786_c2_g2~~TRINITY_DN2786_c2_g2_i1.p1  ORF type:complete len:750 (+),score=131.19 TRINITY_DN2786_c2_g2_i1:151-2400(+)
MTSSNVMRDTFKLPKLPGNNFQEEMMRKSFKKRQVMQPLTGPKPIDVDKIPVDFEAIKIAQEEIPDDHSGGLTLDRRVLRFTAYFREGVHESRLESDRVRRCLIYYFLEDDTISVSEPREDNAGMPQGCMLKRHQIAKPDGQPYSFEDLNVGKKVVFYQKTFVLCDCDAFTRSFLTGLGLDVGEPTPFPSDKYQEARNKPDKKPRDAEDKHLVAVMEYNYSGKRSRLSSEELKAAKQFLVNDRKVLKFKASWDDRNSLYGDDRKFTLYYFLADDTVEVTEDLPLNAGRDPFPSFVRRRKCAKPTDRFENPKASLCFKNDPQNYYSDEDLYVGATVDVFGRKFTLISCDEFTDKYLQEHHGREPAVLTVRPADEKVPQKPKLAPPPYNGFGDEDDSLGSWKNLVLKPPKKNVKQYIENSGTMLKFSMKMDSTDPANEVRRFVLTYFMADDTVSIFEPAQRNSGIIGGKFLQRQKAKHSGTGQPLRADDLFVGARISVNNHKFILFATDEKSLSYMEQNSKSFVHSNINAIMRKLRAMMLSSHTNLEERIIAADRDGNGAIDYLELTAMFEKLNLPIEEHDTLTLLRYLDVNRDGSVTYAEMLHSILPEGGANTVNRPWREILQESDIDIKWEESTREDELNRQQSRTMSAAARAANIVKERFEARRALFISAITNASDKSADNKIGAKEFSHVIQQSLKLPIDAPSLASLCSKIFPASLPRVDVAEMIRIIQGTSLHSATIPGIAAQGKK